MFPAQSVVNRKPDVKYHQAAEDDLNTTNRNILNDDCLQLVLLKLKDIADFWSAAKVYASDSKQMHRHAPRLGREEIRIWEIIHRFDSI